MQDYINGTNTNRTNTQPREVCSQNCECVPEESRKNCCQNNGKKTEEVGSKEPPYFCFFHRVPYEPATCKTENHTLLLKQHKIFPAHNTQNSGLSLGLKVIISGAEERRSFKNQPSDTAGLRRERSHRAGRQPPPAPTPLTPPSALPHRRNRLTPFRARALPNRPAPDASSPLPLQPGHGGGGAASGQASGLGLARGHLPRAVRECRGAEGPARPASYRSLTAPPGSGSRRYPHVTSGAGPEAAVGWWCC